MKTLHFSPLAVSAGVLTKRFFFKDKSRKITSTNFSKKNSEDSYDRPHQED
jgi:hypothetical protein